MSAPTLDLAEMQSAAARACEHFVDTDAQFFNGLAEAFKFAMRVFGDGIGYNNTRLV